MNDIRKSVRVLTWMMVATLVLTVLTLVVTLLIQSRLPH